MQCNKLKCQGFLKKQANVINSSFITFVINLKRYKFQTFRLTKSSSVIIKKMYLCNPIHPVSTN